ncbi:MAG: ribosome small subunit-dependent GTPase A [Holophaga sp.]|jgi:ribosome biogenesis GTPase
MSRKFRLGQSRDAEELDAPDAYAREGRAQSKRRQQSAERLTTDNEAHDSDAMLLLPDPGPWMHLPEATLVWRYSQMVDLEPGDGTRVRASLAGKLKGVKLTVGDRLRYIPAGEPGAPGEGNVQVVAVMPRRTLLKRGGIDDREPWQLICANADELWACASVVDPPLRPGLLERAQALALAAGMGFRIVITKRDRASREDTLPELDPLRAQGLPILETSASREQGLEPLRELLRGRVVVLLGHSGVGKSTLINALVPELKLRTGEMSRYGTGRQTTTWARWLTCPGGGVFIDTPGLRTLSVRGLPRTLLPRVFPEFPEPWLEDPMGLDPEDERLGLEYPERLVSLQRLWAEMEERNPNQNVHR